MSGTTSLSIVSLRSSAWLRLLSYKHTVELANESGQVLAVVLIDTVDQEARYFPLPAERGALRQDVGQSPIVADHALAVDQHNVRVLQAPSVIFGPPVLIGFHRVPKVEAMLAAVAPDLIDDDVRAVMVEG